MQTLIQYIKSVFWPFLCIDKQVLQPWVDMASFRSKYMKLFENDLFRWVPIICYNLLRKYNLLAQTSRNSSKTVIWLCSNTLKAYLDHFCAFASKFYNLQTIWPSKIYNFESKWLFYAQTTRNCSKTLCKRWFSTLKVYLDSFCALQKVPQLWV